MFAMCRASNEEDAPVSLQGQPGILVWVRISAWTPDRNYFMIDSSGGKG